MPLLHSKKLIFLHVPKTGGSSIEKLLALHPSQVENSEKVLSGGPKQLQHLTLPEIMKRKQHNLSGYMAFGIVRNPLDRMMSEFKWRCKSKHPIVEGLTLNEFVTQIHEKWNCGVKLDSHFTPQSEFFVNSAPTIISSVKIFRFEDGFEHIHSFLNQHYDGKLNHIPRINHTDRHIIKDKFNDSSIGKLHKMFKTDFDAYY